MPYTTLISAEELAPHLDDPQWVVADCRFVLAEPGRGRTEYLASHIAGAVYVHLDEDLSGPVVPGRTGRHPLPEPATLAATLGAWGIGPGIQVVVYDAAGAAYAARLWWLLRWLGHEAVAALDGGWQAWQQFGGAVRGGAETRAPRTFQSTLRPDLVLTPDDVDAWRQDAAYRVIDSRTLERYRGLNETIDPVAGHIPGAICAPYGDNLDPAGRFLPAAALRARFEALLAGRPAERAVFYCGSGVSAAQNLLALAHAGLGQARLYAGSWSEWIADGQRPIALGDEAERR
jgi:thiosulfate/3-mercaptopyruvate sulfurtransferase